MLWLILILVIAFGVAHIYDAGVFGRYIPGSAYTVQNHL